MPAAAALALSSALVLAALLVTLLLLFRHHFCFLPLDLVADAAHLVETAFGAVTDDDLPSSEEFLLAEANDGVADAAAFGVVLCCVELVTGHGRGDY